MAQLPTVNIPGAYVGPGEANLPYAEGWSAFAGPNPFASGSLPRLPGLPELPELPALGDIFNPNYNWWTGKRETMGETASTMLGDAAWWLSGRIVVTILGLILVVAGLYLFGTSDVASALRDSVRRGTA